MLCWAFASALILGLRILVFPCTLIASKLTSPVYLPADDVSSYCWGFMIANNYFASVSDRYIC